MESIGLFLVGLSGLAWTIVYISLIRIGFKEKTYGMPLFALAFNVAWEVLYTINGFSHNPTGIQTWVNLIWTSFDFIIIFTYFKHGKAEFKQYIDPKYFVPWSLLVFTMAAIVQYGFYIQFDTAQSPNLAYVRDFIDPHLGAWYSAFLQNLLMSVLFINMLVTRKGDKGQSLTIAVAKWIGTLAPTILFGIILENSLVLIAGIFCTVFDIIYIFLLAQYKKETTVQK